MSGLQAGRAAGQQCGSPGIRAGSSCSVRKPVIQLLSNRRQRWPTPPQAVAGGGGTSGAGGGGGGGGGGGDESPSGGGGKAAPLAGLLAGWKERVAFDPEFPLKVGMEQVIGVGASVVGDMSSRPNWGLYELDLVFATLVVGSILNFTIMYLLAPTRATAAAGGAGGGLLQRILSESILKSWGAPGANMFEPGAYPISKRLLNFLYKGGVFSAIGFSAGILGTATSNGLLGLRKVLDPKFQTQNAPPDILFNAATWALHMGLSANLRYQVLGGVDRVLYGVMPLTVFRLYQAVIRCANNIVGGISFVTLARVLGSQKANTAALPAAAAGEAAAVPVLVTRKEASKKRQ